ncbi:hypothetical protein Avbf_06824 [Armadillidium vulgare]|nr:hypothetical protein Avbf_06824 [Armadillidium vulgare]
MKILIELFYCLKANKNKSLIHYQLTESLIAKSNKKKKLQITLPRPNGRAGRSYVTPNIGVQMKSQEILPQHDSSIGVTSVRRNSFGGDRNCGFASLRGLSGPGAVGTGMVTFKDLKDYKETSLGGPITVGTFPVVASISNEPLLNRTSSYKQVSIGDTTTFKSDQPLTNSNPGIFKDYANFSNFKERSVETDESFNKDNQISSGMAGVVGYKSSTTPTINHRSRAAARYQVSEYSFEQEHPDSPFSDERDSEEKKKVWTIYTWRHWCVLAAVLILSGSVVLAVALPLTVKHKLSSKAAQTAAIDRVLSRVPLIDGHNDLAWNIRNFIHNKLEKVDIGRNLSAEEPWSTSPWSHTDLYRLVHGRIGAQE